MKKAFSKIIVIKLKQLKALEQANLSNQDWLRLEQLSQSEEKLVAEIKSNETSLAVETLYAFYLLLEKQFLKNLKKKQDQVRADFMVR